MAATTSPPFNGATSPAATLNPFDEELKSFKSRLKPREKEYFKFSTEHEFAKEIDALQTRLHKGRRQQNMTKLKGFIEAMTQFGKVIDVFCQTSEVVAFVWGPWKLLLLIGDTFSSAFSELLDTYQQLGRTLRLLLQTSDLFADDTHMAEVLAVVYRDVLDFHFEAFKYFQQPMLKQIYHATWKTYKTKFSDLIHNLNQHRLLILGQTTLAQARRARELETERRQLDRSDRDCRTRERVIGWLQGASSGTNVKNDHAKLLKIRHNAPNSGRWLLSKPEFERWFGRFPSIPTLLWINGIPGAGKTVLASVVVEEAQALSHKPTVLYFYCKADNPDKNNFLAIGRQLILQVLEKNPDLLYYFDNKYQSSTEATLTTISDLEEILETGIKNSSSVYIILDGIDECPAEETKTICRWFRKLVEDLPTSNPDQIRCLFVSQDDKVTRPILGDLSTLKIRPSDNLDDITQFSSQWGLAIQTRFGLRDEERNSIAQRVPGVCGGIFLLAKLIWENLYEQANIDDLYTELQPNTFPQAIDEAYERIMARLCSHGPRQGKTDYCLLLLGWLVCAKRPLKWWEIQTARSIDLEAQTVNLDRYSFRDGPKSICGSLVEEDDAGTVELVHSTAKQFLTRNKYVDSFVEEIKFAILCVNYLNLSGFQLPLIDIEPLIVIGHYNFLEYATLHWARHLESALGHVQKHVTLGNELAESIDCFIDLHFVNPTITSVLPSKQRRKWKFFETSPFFEKLSQAFVSTRKHLTTFEEMNVEERALDVFDILQEVRQCIELMATNEPTPRTAESLEMFFGKNLFKCSRPSCHFFERGFMTSHMRNLHVEKHLRPFVCPLEGCPTSAIGVATTRDLDIHLRDTHGIGGGDTKASDFPTEEELRRPSPPPEESPRSMSSPTETSESEPENTKSKVIGVTASGRKQEGIKPKTRRRRAEHICPTCSKIFTKRFNLQSHMRSHSTHRPYKCDYTEGGTECNKAFVRQSDLTRHLKSHNEGQYLCDGTMPDGTRWGCGRSFSRADILRSHLASQAGALCQRLHQPNMTNEV